MQDAESLVVPNKTAIYWPILPSWLCPSLYGLPNRHFIECNSFDEKPVVLAGGDQIIRGEPRELQLFGFNIEIERSKIATEWTSPRLVDARR
jgi:hypothetical protein